MKQFFWIANDLCILGVYFHFSVLLAIYWNGEKRISLSVAIDKYGQN